MSKLYPIQFLSKAKVSALLIMLALIFAINIQAQTVYLGSWDAINYPATCTWNDQDNETGAGATDSNTYASWEAAWEAVDNLGNQTIQILPSVYIGSFDYDGDGLSESCTNSQIAIVANIDSNDDGLSILGNPNGCGTLIDLSSGSSTTVFSNMNGVNGFTLKDIYFKSWGGVLEMYNSTNVVIENCVFDNTDNAQNSVLIDLASSVTFINCTFVGSKATSFSKQVKIVGGSTATFNNCTFTCNADPGQEGGTVFIGNPGGTVTFNGGVFAGNTAVGTSGAGGAIRINDGVVNIIGTSFCNNTSETTEGQSGGGALSINGGTVTITGANFNGNTAANNGGAIAFARDVSNPIPLVINGNTIFDGNTAPSGQGGAIFSNLETTLLVSDSYFTGNTAVGGGGIFMDCDDQSASFNLKQNVLTVSDCTFESNTSTSSNRGGGIHVYFTETSEDVPAHGPADLITISGTTMCGNSSGTASMADLGENTQPDGAFGPDVVTSVNISSANNDIGEGQSSNGDSSMFDQGDCAAISSGWTGTNVAAACVAFDCLTDACAMEVPGSCFVTQYAETSDFVCVDPAATGMVSGQIWIDQNGDGVQDAVLDPGYAGGVVVIIYDSNGYQLGFTTTDASGNYSFNGLPLDETYTIEVQNPDPATYAYISPINAGGSTEPTDSDANSITDATSTVIGGIMTVTITTAAPAATDVDAGFAETIILPIELTSFDVSTIANCIVELKWETATEIDNNYFEIQTSLDGVNFKTVARVNGAGTTYQAQTYTYKLDRAIQNSYYRLMQVDFDGSSSYSNVRFEKLSCGNSLTVQGVIPNPVRGKGDYRVVAQSVQEVQLEIMNALGQIEYRANITLNAGTNDLALPAQGLGQGVYFVRLLDANSEVIDLTKFIKY